MGSRAASRVRNHRMGIPAVMSSRALLAQLRAELVLASRRGEALLVTFLVPPMLLAFFASVPLIPTGGESRIAVLLPGMAALAIVAAAMVALGIGTAYERHYGVLKRLGALPGAVSTVILAKALAVLVIEVAHVPAARSMARRRWARTAGVPIPGLRINGAGATGRGPWTAGVPSHG